MLGSTFAVIALSSLIVIADGVPVRDGLLVAGITGVIALFFLAFVNKKWQDHRSKPAQLVGRATGENADSESTSIRESWDEGKERGENWKDRMDAAPEWVFNAAVLFGCVLSLSVWGVALLEFDTALLVSLLLGMLGLYLSIVLDVKRMNRVYGTGFKWYAYGIPAAIPLIGWVFGLVWLLRKRGERGVAAAT
jgi:uncharacterized membrane protein YqjE